MNNIENPIAKQFHINMPEYKMTLWGNDAVNELNRLTAKVEQLQTLVSWHEQNQQEPTTPTEDVKSQDNILDPADYKVLAADVNYAITKLVEDINKKLG